MRPAPPLRGLAPALVLAGLLLAVPVARAGETCDAPPRGPVSLFILQTDTKVQAFAKTVRDADVVRRDPTTVVFADGRIVTADVTAASRYINELGWGSRRLDIAASFPRRAPRPRRGYG